MIHLEADVLVALLALVAVPLLCVLLLRRCRQVAVEHRSPAYVLGAVDETP